MKKIFIYIKVFLTIIIVNSCTSKNEKNLEIKIHNSQINNTISSKIHYEIKNTSDKHIAFSLFPEIITPFKGKFEDKSNSRYLYLKYIVYKNAKPSKELISEVNGDTTETNLSKQLRLKYQFKMSRNYIKDNFIYLKPSETFKGTFIYPNKDITMYSTDEKCKYGFQLILEIDSLEVSKYLTKDDKKQFKDKNIKLFNGEIKSNIVPLIVKD